MSTKNSRQTVTVATEVLTQIYDTIGTPLARNLKWCLERRDYRQLVTWPAPAPEDYSDADLWADDYLAYSVASKFADFDTGIDRSKVAIQKFMESEEVCASVNRKFSYCDVRRTFTPYVRDILVDARRKIAKALGPFNWDEADVHFGFGPGATNGISRRQSDPFYKFGDHPTTTTCNLYLASAAIQSRAPWYRFVRENEPSPDAEDWFTVVAGNKVVTVPKNAKTDRTIAAEPTMNGFIQRGIGVMLRHRLRRVGVNLDDQTRNQELARVGSLSGSLATIDLRAASDSISLRLVEELLPDDWSTAIKLCRSPRGVLPDGTLTTYQKVSSMGNTYTFELESLIFWAISKSVMESLGEGRGRLGIYGDDIVVPAGVARTLLKTLEEVGFYANPDKTFTEGPFRESCGKHYFSGVDVTPFYLREEPRTLAGLISLANSIRLYAMRRGRNGFSPSRWRPVYEYVVRLCRAKARRKLPRVPLGFGDAGLISSFDEAVPRWIPHLYAWEVTVYTGISKEVRRGGPQRLLRSLYKMEQREGGLRAASPYDVAGHIDLLLRIPETRAHVLYAYRSKNYGNPIKKYERHEYDTTHVTLWPEPTPWFE